MKSLISSTDTAKLLGIKPQTLRLWRYKGIGPKFVRYQNDRGRVYYSMEEIERFIQERTFSSTTEVTVGRSDR